MAKKKFEKTNQAGTRLCARNKDGTWRKKRSDAGVRTRGIRARFRSQRRRFSDSVDVVREHRDAG
jgi:hypothetical protein